MNKLIFLFIILAGKLYAQKVAQQPLIERTVSGSAQNREGDKIPGCTVRLMEGDDTLITTTDTTGRFVFKDVKSPRFYITIASPGYFSSLAHYQNSQSAHIMLDPVVLSPIISTKQITIQTNWQTGDKIDAVGAPDNLFHQAIVLAVNNESNTYKVHYLDIGTADAWIPKKYTRQYNMQFKADSAAAAEGLRPGKYVMYVYYSDVGRYQGYFIIKTDGSYEVLPDGRNDIGVRYGKGKYKFNKRTGIVTWRNGPFAVQGGKSRLRVSLDGQAYVLKHLTVGDWSGSYYASR